MSMYICMYIHTFNSQKDLVVVTPSIIKTRESRSDRKHLCAIMPLKDLIHKVLTKLSTRLSSGLIVQLHAWLCPKTWNKNGRAFNNFKFLSITFIAASARNPTHRFPCFFWSLRGVGFSDCSSHAFAGRYVTESSELGIYLFCT